VAYYQIVVRWSVESKLFPGFSHHLGERSLYSTPLRNEGAVEIEEKHVRPPALGEDESVSLAHSLKEGGRLKGGVGNRRASEKVKQRGELIEIAGQEPADLGEQKLVELAQKSDIDLANLVHPDVIRRASPVQNVSSDPVICRNSTSPLRRTVGLGDNVDPFALGS